MKNKAVKEETLCTFPKGGIHPEGHKGLTQDLPIEVMPIPKEVSLFIKQHVGAPCIVSEENAKFELYSEDYFLEENISRIKNKKNIKEKNIIMKRDIIGSVGNNLGANLHASVSGEAGGIIDTFHPELVQGYILDWLP